MKNVERLFTFETIQKERQKTCAFCGKKTKRGEKVHHVSEFGTMTTMCDECFEKYKKEDQEA